MVVEENIVPDAGVAGAGVSRCIAEVVIHADEPLSKEALEPFFPEAIGIACEIIGTHLVYGNRDDQFGWFVFDRYSLWRLG